MKFQSLADLDRSVEGGTLTEARRTPTNEQLELVQSVFDTVVEAHMDTCIYTTNKVAEGKAKYRLMNVNKV